MSGLYPLRVGCCEGLQLTFVVAEGSIDVGDELIGNVRRLVRGM